MNAIKTWTDLSAASDSDIMAWARSQPWAQRMAECMQDPQWHAEGDVWTHTRMVCDELAELPQWTALSRATQLKLLLTAIFHDSAKPERTIIEETTGRIRSPKHAQYGARIARRALMKLGCDYQTREQICRLVLFHGRPPYLDKQESAQHELIKLSWYVDHRLLHAFAMADTRGRTCEQSYSEDILNLWTMVAEENNCLDQPYRFANDQARFLFFRGQLDNLHYSPHEDYRCKMTIMTGLPGAGKDTWLRQNREELPVVSLDAIRREFKVAPTDNQGKTVQVAKERCRQHLRQRRDFAFNATNTTRQIRQLWVDVGAEYGARIELVYIEPDTTTLIDQNRNRESRVPVAVIEELIDKMDPPTQAECHEIVYVV